MHFRSSLRRVLPTFAALLLALPAANAQTVFSASGATAGDIQTTVDNFRTALGTLNANNGTSNASGRREINWDGVPAGFQSPNLFTGDFFAQAFNGSNGGRTRGALFDAGLGNTLLVSPVAGDANALFATQLANSDVSFPPFSNDKVFLSGNSTTMEVSFVVPGTSDVTASVNAFGAVFMDVELASTTSLEFFATSGASLGVFDAAVSGAGGFSFLGVLFDPGVTIGLISIKAGSETLSAFADGSALRESTGDLVGMDDFIFSEPQAFSAVPEPSSYAAILGGLALGLTALQRRRREPSRPAADPSLS